MKKIIILLHLFFIIFNVNNSLAEKPLKVGWISPLSGGAEKYGAHKSLKLALSEINKKQKVLDVIIEDGGCNAKKAISAAKKLVYLNKVSIIIGGHCSTESAAIANFMEQNKKLMIASISSTPILSNFKNYVFRTSPNSKNYADILLKEFLKKDINKIAILYEETEYASYPAINLNTLLKEKKKETKILGFNSNNIDFNSVILNLKKFNPDAFYIATQTQDVSINILKTIRQYKIKTNFLGNEVFASTLDHFPELKSIVPNLNYGEVKYNPKKPKASKFIDSHLKLFKEKPPYGFWSADAYDGVKIVAKVVSKCGKDVEKIRSCLRSISYQGASGKIEFDINGDAKREYLIKTIK